MRLTRLQISKAISASYLGVIVCGSVIFIIAAVNYLFLSCAQLCVFRAITGLPCPGCGLTHSGLSLLHGNIVGSLRYHALLVPYLITIVANTIRINFRVVNWLRSCWWLWFLLIVSFCYYIVRILLFFPAGPYPMVYDHRSYLYRGLKIMLRWNDQTSSKPARCSDLIGGTCYAGNP